MSTTATWRRCSACKGPIAVSSTYWVCNVSTCNRKRTGLVFCNVSCWEVHLPIANHRESWAVEKTAPAVAEPSGSSPPASTGEKRRIVAPPTPTTSATTSATANLAPRAKADTTPQEVLIVASRLKDYVQARSGFNTSDRVLEPLSAIVRRACDEAIRNATRDGRKTILDRDVPKP